MNHISIENVNIVFILNLNTANVIQFRYYFMHFTKYYMAEYRHICSKVVFGSIEILPTQYLYFIRTIMIYFQIHTHGVFLRLLILSKIFFYLIICFTWYNIKEIFWLFYCKTNSIFWFLCLQYSFDSFKLRFVFFYTKFLSTTQYFISLTLHADFSSNWRYNINHDHC